MVAVHEAELDPYFLVRRRCIDGRCCVGDVKDDLGSLASRTLSEGRSRISDNMGVGGCENRRLRKVVGRTTYQNKRVASV